MNNPKPEVLAPAGDLDAAFAAFEHGADAVYLGLQRFSARADAANFTPDELGEIAAYAHGQTVPRRVYATVNTLVQQDELPELVETLAVLSETGADAIIVQDLGVARIARALFPALRLHASTQMAVHNVAGARALRELGFSRVTLARELSLKEIRAIAAAGGIEVEVFVHGALCYCYSGLCLYSSHLRGRSGNRGRCAYPCREAFRAADGRSGHPFSMKDMARVERVGDLAAAGVASLKIEGRKKNPLYVACLAQLYRGAVDGTLSRSEREAMAADAQTIFSRPWTELYLDGESHRGAVDAETVGHRGARIGAVAGVSSGAPPRRGEPAAGRRLRFVTNRALERHDGIQVDLPGESAPYGFAVDDLWVSDPAGRSRRSAFAVNAGAWVEVALPADAPEIPEGAAVYCASSQAVKRTYTFSRPRPGIWAFRQQLRAALSVCADRVSWRASVELNLPGAPVAAAAGECAGRFEPARDAGVVAEAARQAFARLGNTRLALADLAVDNPAGLFVPASVLNGVRRAAAEAVEAEAAQVRAVWVARARERVGRDVPDVTPRAEGRETWALKTDQPECLADFTDEDWAGVDELVVELNPDALPTLDDWMRQCPLPRDRVRIALPVLARGEEEAALNSAVRHWRDTGWSRWEVGGLAGWTCLRERGEGGPQVLDLSADWTLYALNASAAAGLAAMGMRSVTLSPEDDLNNWRRLPEAVARMAVAPVYQDSPLFVSETCVRGEACARCRQEGGCRRTETMVSASGDRVIAISHHCRTTVVGERPFCLAAVLGELRAAGLRHFRVDFMHRPYTPERAREVWRAVRSGRAPGPCHTGNVRRGIDAGARQG